MAPIRLFTDEDVYGSVAPKLREKGFDAVSTAEENRLGKSDESQLEWAVQEGRVLLTFNVSDFARLHDEWLEVPATTPVSSSRASVPSVTCSTGSGRSNLF